MPTELMLKALDQALILHLEGARLEVACYLDTYFSLARRHSALGYRSPHQFERDFQLNLS